jgi:hypothetical protein
MPAAGTRSRDLGQRIADARKLHRMTQEQLARRCAISVSLLRKIEQGSRPATPSAWQAISRTLRLGEAGPGHSSSAGGRVAAAIPQIRSVADCYDLPEDGPVASLPALRAAVDQVTAWRLQARYTSLAAAFPQLLADLTRTAHGCTVQDQETAFGLLAIGYRAADALCDKFGYPDLSARTIELMRWAAARSADPVLEAVAAYVRAETFFTSQRPAMGLGILEAAAAPLLKNGSRESLAVYGSLHMRAAVLAACAGMSQTTASHLAEARDIARRVPDATYRGTAFGPSSVRIHEIAAAAETGDSTAMLRAADGWQPPPAVPAERRSHFYIELARAHLWAGHHADALAALQAARQIAPQHTRHSPRVHQTARTLIRQQRHPGAALTRFAGWATGESHEQR